MSVDVNRCDRILLPFSQISVSPILLAIAIWQIYVRMGNAIWGALGTTVFFLLLNIGQVRGSQFPSTSGGGYELGSRNKFLRRLIRTHQRAK